MDHRITQCPRCGTSFRVTEAHLAVAAGAVRCGSCLHIFNARDHWVETEPAKPAAVEKPLEQQQIDNIEIDDDALFDDDTPLFDDEATQTKTKNGSIFNPVDDDFAVVDDDSPEELSDTFLDINSWEEESSHAFNSKPDAASVEEESAELEWAQKLLEEDDEKTGAGSNAPERSALFDDFDGILDSVPEIDETEAQPRHQSESAEFSDEFLNLDADYTPPRRETATIASTYGEEISIELTPVGTVGERATANSSLFALRDFEQEPLQLHQFVHEPRWPKILWGLALVAAIGLGAWQYFYFNFAELARGPLRPWLARACSVAGCALPPQFDLGQIHTNSLIVRSHPTQRGALVVDAVITNQADFPQPYPTLQLQFSDLHGAPIAGRRFQPAEYLSGELTGSRLMSVRQPIHVALELVDPGPKAVNYQLTIVAPETSH